MAPLTKGRTTPARSGDIREHGVLAATHLFAGSLAAITVAGLLVPMSAAVGLRGLGRCEGDADNSDGADGAINARVSAGIHRFANSAGDDLITTADIGRECYGVDDQTVAKTLGNGARSVAGIVYDVDANGVWVDFRAPANRATEFDRINLPTLTGTPVVRMIATRAGKIKKITSVLQAALTTGNATITVAINGVAVTTGVLTITQAGSAAGDIDTAEPTALNTVAAGDIISFTVGGTNAAAVAANLTLEIVR
ncbi:hypothetical protein PSC71_08345 [Devosia sp. J2-20]|uniref:hypothetical protein n=1 Tax=Devosia sp. J2-20 TaxID=3026161 RepID=UPI002499E690|nr:hypothetical protein [Devosia sp. J2-20]WDR00743.1 hypothetical protein PSC71_08345 [Devosia sp. J2-20]